jgi:hypothetical protein
LPGKRGKSCLIQLKNEYGPVVIHGIDVTASEEWRGPEISSKAKLPQDFPGTAIGADKNIRWFYQVDFVLPDERAGVSTLETIRNPEAFESPGSQLQCVIPAAGNATSCPLAAAEETVSHQ